MTCTGTLRIFTLEVTPVAQNCRVLVDDAQKRAIVVDPGGEVDVIKELLSRDALTLDQIWLTHSHFDHCGGVAELKEATGAVLVAHPGESLFRQHVLTAVERWQLPLDGFRNCPEPDRALLGGERLEWSGYTFHVLPTPGHSPGHLAFYCPQEGFVLSGDALFQGSIGRTDLPGGNHQELIESIIGQLLSLSDSTQVLSGHGPDTTIGHERRYNRYLGETLHSS
jgi:hydroxyacylglutathione hydrolase